MPSALCRRHRRPDVVVANPDLPVVRGRSVARRPGRLTLVAALVAALGLLAGGCGGGGGKTEPPKLVSRTFVAVADSYVRKTEPRGNFGKNSELRVDGTPPVRAYLEFQPFGISGKIQHATLKVYPLSTSTDGFQVRGTSGEWTESRLTFENAPPVGGVINISGPLSKERWQSIDVTRLLRSPAATVRMALVALGPTELALGSRETPRFAPRLTVESRRVAAG